MKKLFVCVLFVIFTMALAAQPLPGTSLEILLKNYKYQQLSNSYRDDDSSVTIFPAYYREDIKSVLARLLEIYNKDHFSIREDKVSADKVVVTVKLKDLDSGVKYYLVAGNEVQTTILSFFYYSNLTNESQLNILLNEFYNSRIIDTSPSNDILLEYSTKVPEKYSILSIDGFSYQYDTVEQRGVSVLSIKYYPSINRNVSLKAIANEDGLDERNIKEVEYNGLNNDFHYWQGIFTYVDKVINKVVVKIDETKYMIISRQIFDEDHESAEIELHEIVDSLKKRQ